MFSLNKLCVFTCSLHGLLVKEAHGRDLIGHFGTTKKLDVWNEHFSWSHMKCDVERFCEKCVTCKQAKSKIEYHRLYTPLAIPTMNLR